MFVFLFVFPKIGQGIGGHRATEESLFADRVRAWGRRPFCHISKGESIALSMAQEFGFPREIEDRLQSFPSGWWQSRRFCLERCRGSLLGLQSSCPSPQLVHAAGVHSDISLHWWIIVTLVPLSCITMGSLGLVLGTSI